MKNRVTVGDRHIRMVAIYEVQPRGSFKGESWHLRGLAQRLAHSQLTSAVAFLESSSIMVCINSIWGGVWLAVGVSSIAWEGGSANG